MGAGADGNGQALLEHGTVAPVGAPTWVPQSGPWGLGLRLALALMLVVGVVQMVLQPVDGTVEELLDDLHAGRVSELTIQRLPDGMEVSGGYRVEWSGDRARRVATYELNTSPDGPEVDEGATILAAAEDSPEPVTVTVTRDWEAPGLHANLTVLAAMFALFVLVLGPQPRLATKWAWFWLTCAAAPIWLLYLILEPVPLWSRGPATARASRLTGGTAFILAILLVPLVLSLIPGASRFYGW
ncbi:hypothetical protein EXU48_14745 [Occultella glacieicola]|uniref:DUF3592 domain-containing protein n=1 Tax=Occultella glacieicola TaxID=2518684 RepID=A0ABY2E2E0_9MICO|nr:hypothetical protein [Occultella glacieicola]TDE92769.1 hypothetical protein EXU48_14745 [Occultella glacieicola]